MSEAPPGRRRVVTAGERTKWAWAGVLLIVLLALLDNASEVQSTFVGLTVVGPFLAAVGVGPVRTALVGGYGVLVAGILLVGDGLGLGTSAHSVRVLALAAGCALAVWVAEQRVRREAALVRLQLVAEAAQRAILRPVPARTGAVAFTARYQSAAEESRIGGDMYEVADTPHGVRVLVGDVRGKGLEAVQLTSLVLGSFREAAYLYPDLTAVAQGMADSTARNVGLEDFVTAVLLELRGDQLGMVNCGHLPPLLLPLHGEPGELHGPITTPLGLSPEPRARLLTWEVGDRVLLYTDGLAEARDRRGTFFPLGTAVRLCGDRAKPLAACADELLTAVTLHVGGRLNDDLAFVLLEREAA